MAAARFRAWPMLCLMVLAGACGGDAASSPSSVGAASAAARQMVADELRELQAAQVVPEHLRARGGPLNGSEFDVERYLGVLTHLDVEPGFVLDFVYRQTPDRGYPILYVRRADALRHLTYDAFVESTGREAYQDDVEYLDQVYVVDGTPQGFFEYALLRLTGSQFYLFWHAQEMDRRIVATPEALEEALAVVRSEMLPEEMARAREADLAPVVAFGDDRVMVQVAAFTRWGGLFRYTFTFGRQFPQDLLDEQWELVARCDCGIPF